jgi:hypothetical protein
MNVTITVEDPREADYAVELRNALLYNANHIDYDPVIIIEGL